MKNFVHTFASVLFIAAASFGTGPAAMAAEDSGGQSASNRTVDLSNLVLPVERDGRLINYLFVSATVTIASGYDHWQARDNAHVLRDRILREAHRHTVGLDGSPMELDEEKFRQALMLVFEQEMGPGSVEAIEIIATDSQLLFVDG